MHVPYTAYPYGWFVCTFLPLPSPSFHSQVLVLNDSRRWRACHGTHHQRSFSGYVAGSDCSRNSSENIWSSCSRDSCRCCCSPDIWVNRSCLAAPVAAGNADPPTAAVHASRFPLGVCAGIHAKVQYSSPNTHRFMVDAAHHPRQSQDEQQQVQSQAVQVQKQLVHCTAVESEDRGSSDEADSSGGSVHGQQGKDGRWREAIDSSRALLGISPPGRILESGVGARSCGCWRHKLFLHALATLGSLRSLEFLLLGLPDDRVSAVEVLCPLTASTGLRSLTLRVGGMHATSAGEVSELIVRLSKLRALNLMDLCAESNVRLGVKDAVYRMPYLT